MQAPHQHLRINLANIKAQIVKRLGPERSKHYFYYLNRLLSLKLSKSEFNKLCYRVLGRENVQLHNQLVRSIIKNACHGKVPPTCIHNKEVKPAGDGYQHTVLLNGYRGVRDHPNALESNGNFDSASLKSTVTVDDVSNVVLENGDLTLSDVRKPAQHVQALNEPTINEGEVSLNCCAKLSSIKGLEDGPASVKSKEGFEVLAVDGGNNAPSKNLLGGPLGVPCCSVSVGGPCKALQLVSSSGCNSSFDSGTLLDTTTIRERMKQIAATQGLEGVSIDSANLLNNGLDIYLKGLIRSCTEQVAARSGCEAVQNHGHKQHNHGKLVNGVRPGNHYQMQSSSRPLKGSNEQKPHCVVSLLDFKVAMELNPHQLGEDWPVLVEKICTHAFEE